ncbi:NUMOD4 domain-containing protein [Nocardia brasiliensis]|uniref:NUMOD4 domain-containing protein n=1 Tax=Nocardia brasiliensis TaxID=37326 RepID=UPI0024587C0D|nr:NUMOD4 domain-containing protein [Nocardia brasiliensis]
MPSPQRIENWRDLPGWEGYYQVSDRGRVRSLARVIHRRNGVPQTIHPRTLSPTLNHHGYLSVQLSRPGTCRRIELQCLVAAAFLGPRPPGRQVLHDNGKATDNRLSNLRYGTPSENQLDSVRHGTHFLASKAHCPRGHQLAEKNLIPSKLAKGHRECLACNRARTWLRPRGNNLAMLQPVADYFYATLAGGVAA